MENRPFGPEPDDTTSESDSTEKKRGGSKLSRYLAGLRRKEHENSREDEEGDEKPKRLKRIFSRLFPSVVEKPTKGTPESTNYGFDPEAWFGVTRFASRSEVSQANMLEETDIPPVTDTTERPLSSTADHEIDVPAQPTETDLGEAQPPAATEDSVAVSNSPETTPDMELTAPQVEQSPNPQGELFIHHEERFETPQLVTTPENATKETVIERGPGMVLPVALVGLEHLGRKKADKKLEKRVNEKIAATSKEVEQSIALQQELQSLRRQNSEQLEALKHARIDRPVESVPSVTRTVEQAQFNRPERVANPEKPVTTVRTGEELSRSSVEQQPKDDVKSERILEQIADAAEHDIPVERVFERSHEVKDDKSIPGAATSVGAVVSSHAANQYQALQQGKQSITDTPTNALPFVNDPVAAAAYKQAVKLGFWAAIMIIILGSIAYLVVK